MTRLASKTISINLENDIKEFDFYDDSIFVLFEKNNVLEYTVYEELRQEIHAMDDFDFIFKNKGEKSKRTINGSNLVDVKDGVFKEFCKAILSEDFFKWFEGTHLPYFETKKKKCFYIRKPESLIFRVLKKICNVTKFPVRFFYTEIEYSSIKKNGYIPPHTDAKNKRLSFVYYIPRDEAHLNEDLKNDLGTVFWKPKISAVSPLRRFDCALLMGKEREKFYSDYEPFHIATYEPNKFAGFIKSDNSWHSVNKIHHDYDRRAIVINIWET